MQFTALEHFPGFLRVLQQGQVDEVHLDIRLQIGVGGRQAAQGFNVVACLFRFGAQPVARAREQQCISLGVRDVLLVEYGFLRGGIAGFEGAEQGVCQGGGAERFRRDAGALQIGCGGGGIVRIVQLGFVELLVYVIAGNHAQVKQGFVGLLPLQKAAGLLQQEDTGGWFVGAGGRSGVGAGYVQRNIGGSLRIEQVLLDEQCHGCPAGFERLGGPFSELGSGIFAFFKSSAYVQAAEGFLQQGRFRVG